MDSVWAHPYVFSRSAALSCRQAMHYQGVAADKRNFSTSLEPVGAESASGGRGLSRFDQDIAGLNTPELRAPWGATGSSGRTPQGMDRTGLGWTAPATEVPEFPQGASGHGLSCRGPLSERRCLDGRQGAGGFEGARSEAGGDVQDRCLRRMGGPPFFRRPARRLGAAVGVNQGRVQDGPARWPTGPRTPRRGVVTTPPPTTKGT